MRPDNDAHEIEQIEKYLAHKLTPPEMAELEKRVAEDPVFAGKVEEMRSALQTIRVAYVQQEAKETLQSLFEQNRRVAPRRTLRFWLGGISAAACAAGIVYFLGFSAIQLPQVEDDLMVIKGDQAPARPASVYERILAGQKAMEKGNYLLAITLLKDIPQQTELRSYFREASGWYLTLAYLNSDQPRMAEKQLDLLDQLDHPEFRVNMISRWQARIQIQRKKWW